MKNNIKNISNINKKNIIIIAFIFITLFTVLSSNIFGVSNNSSKNKLKAEVVKIVEYREDVLEYETYSSTNSVQVVKIKIKTDGIYKEKEYTVDYNLGESGTTLNNSLREGQNVFVEIHEDTGSGTKVYILDVDRMPYIIAIIIVFAIVVILIGGIQGIKTVVSLVITVLTVLKVFLPMILDGHSAILASIITCFIITSVSLSLVSGINRKTLTTIVSTISGVIIAGILCIIVSNLADVTGLVNDEAQMLIYITDGKGIDIRGLFFASVVIGSVGATMDMSMSIASAMNEVSKSSDKISKKDLIKSGMNVGKDSMSTMANTLVLAYVGESLLLLLLLSINNGNLSSIINSDFIAAEILRSLCGTIGMILSIPITTYLFGYISNNKSLKEN